MHNGEIYLDETKLSPEVPLHEYTHLWDNAVKKINPELWNRGIELMKQTSLWQQIAQDENYGKKWEARKEVWRKQGKTEDEITHQRPLYQGKRERSPLPLLLSSGCPSQGKQNTKPLPRKAEQYQPAAEAVFPFARLYPTTDFPSFTISLVKVFR